MSEFYEEMDQADDARDEFGWHVAGFKQYILEGIKGTDELIYTDHHSWKEIITQAVHELHEDGEI